MQKILGTLFLSGAFAAGAAQAHYLWIEADNAGAKLYYGEADALLKEKSPGKLDNFQAPKAYVQASANAKPAETDIKRGAQYFSIAVPKKTAAVLVTEESMEVKDLSKHKLGLAKSNYYAREGHPAASADNALPLDVLASAPNHLTVLYRGQPLKGAKVEVIAPNTWVQEHKTNAQGNIEINTPWRGQYVVHVLYVDATPGEFAGKKYESLRNHFTYTFVRKAGAYAGPAVPPKHMED
ncbi:MAG: DUF4198 domain-containing protein [Proteobacteria bacterium]|nr:DUF4198 domain-containing protein [Pseudomonadota bacterium]